MKEVDSWYGNVSDYLLSPHIRRLAAAAWFVYYCLPHLWLLER